MKSATYRHLAVALAVGLVLPATLTRAQETQREGEGDATPLEVQIVFSKYRGEELTVNLPYSLVVKASEAPRPTQLRLGIEIPLTIDAEGTQRYRNVGTNIDCRAKPASDGRFELDVTVEQSSLFSPDASDEGGGVGTPGNLNPLFRTFSSNHVVALRDGESVELSSAADPISGEVSKVQVSLRVLSR